jgi:hypothetical protein
MQQAAAALAPYKIKQPHVLPNGAWLYAMSWLPLGAETVGGKTFSVDLIYKLSDGTSIHLWQTNQDLAASGKDPTNAGTLVSVGQDSWRRSQFNVGSDSRLSLSRRFNDGTTVALYGSVQEDVLRNIAASVAG